MKKIIFTIAIGIFLINSVSASDPYKSIFHRNIPEGIKDYMKANYPEVKKIEWSEEPNNKYEAYFIHNDKEITLRMLSDGKVIHRETELSEGELPAKIVENLPQGSVIEYSSKIHDSNKGYKYYVEIKQDRKLKEMSFDKSGNRMYL